MQCPMEVTTQSGVNLLVTAAVGCSGGVASILTDGGTAARSSGTFMMQPGTYQVQFYAETGANCSFVQPALDGGPVSLLISWISSSNDFCETQTPPVSGIIAGAAIIQFGPNQTLNLATNSVTRPERDGDYYEVGCSVAAVAG
jgi:hypothetical protein